jgi:hypothetical protein
VALLAGRIPVWPDFACASPWLRAPKGSEGLGGWLGEAWRTDMQVVPRQPLVDVAPAARRCLAWHFYDASCDVHVRAPASPMHP